jgi:hypothetical protein
MTVSELFVSESLKNVTKESKTLIERSRKRSGMVNGLERIVTNSSRSRFKNDGINNLVHALNE